MRHIILQGLFLFVIVGQAMAANFSSGNEPAIKYGVHEISLSGNGVVSNPFDIHATVTFRSPSGSAKTVNAFYDDSNTWRARVYVTESGGWSWSSSCASDAGLNGKNGSFSASASTPLKGMIKKHSSNARAWMTDNGKTFLNIADTAYYLFTNDADPWQAYVRDDWNYGITMVRANIVGALRDWQRFFQLGSNRDKFEIANFKRDDVRMQWMLDNYPGMYVELIMFPESNTGWTYDENFWKGMTSTQKNRLLRFLVARYAAYPQIMWEIGNDYNYTKPNNIAMANEVGNYVKANDPWGHLITTGGLRDQPFKFANAAWCGFAHVETIDAYAGDQADDYGAKHVFNGEDRYESHKAPKSVAYYFSRMNWAWLLSGGSACYGGIWDRTINYTNSNLTGLNSMRYIRPFLENRAIDLAQFTPNDALATDSNGATGKNRVKLANRGTNEYLAMITGGEGDGAYIKPRPNIVPGCSINLAGASGTFNVEWMNGTTGAIANGGTVTGGGKVTLKAPWVYTHVIVRLYKSGSTPPPPPPANVAPVAQNQSVSTAMGVAKAITLSATDANGDVLTYSIVSGPAHGALSGTAPALTYTPAAAYSGSDSFTFKASDASLSSNTATVSITVTSTPVTTYALTVNSGNGDGSYATGAVVTITAAAAPAGQVFAAWTGSVSSVADVNAATTTLTMPAAATTVTATYKSAPPVTGGVVYEAEQAVVSGAVKYATYVDYINTSGDYIEWSVNAATAGQHTLTFRYAHGSGDRPLKITVDGVVAAASLSFPGTGSTSTYKTVTLIATLKAGINKVRATAIGSSGSNIDSLTVAPVAPTGLAMLLQPEHIMASMSH